MSIYIYIYEYKHVLHDRQWIPFPGEVPSCTPASCDTLPSLGNAIMPEAMVEDGRVEKKWEIVGKQQIKCTYIQHTIRVHNKT